MDEFYRIVTGEDDAFYQMCPALPTMIEEVVKHSDAIKIPSDTVFDELMRRADSTGSSFTLALYLLGFETYLGFKGAII